MGTQGGTRLSLRRGAMYVSILMMVLAAGVVLFSLDDSSGTAAAESPSAVVTPECDGLTVDLSGYGAASPGYGEFNNNVSVSIDAEADNEQGPFLFDFNEAFSQQFPWDGTGAQDDDHRFVVRVDANLNSGHPTDFDMVITHDDYPALECGASVTSYTSDCTNGQWVIGNNSDEALRITETGGPLLFGILPGGDPQVVPEDIQGVTIIGDLNQVVGTETRPQDCVRDGALLVEFVECRIDDGIAQRGELAVWRLTNTGSEPLVDVGFFPQWNNTNAVQTVERDIAPGGSLETAWETAGPFGTSTSVSLVYFVTLGVESETDPVSVGCSDEPELDWSYTLDVNCAEPGTHTATFANAGTGDIVVLHPPGSTNFVPSGGSYDMPVAYAAGQPLPTIGYQVLAVDGPDTVDTLADEELIWADECDDAPEPGIDFETLESVVIDGLPFINYNVVSTNGFDTTGETVTLTFTDDDGNEVDVLSGLPIAGQVPWPGVTIDPPDIPGWVFQNGEWVTDPSDAVLTQGLTVTADVNPSITVRVEYPAGVTPDALTRQDTTVPTTTTPEDPDQDQSEKVKNNKNKGEKNKGNKNKGQLPKTK